MRTKIWFMNNVRKLLAKALPDNTGLQILCNLPKMETWRRSHKENFPYFKSHKHDLYDYIQKNIFKEKVSIILSLVSGKVLQ